MKKILSVLLLLVTFAYASVIKDQLNREVVLSDKVDRIVVLQHQSLNVLVQIGAKDKIVGVLQSWENVLEVIIKGFLMVLINFQHQVI